MEIIRNQKIVTDAWRHLADDEAVPAEGDVTVTVTRWNTDRDALAARTGQTGVRLAPADEPDTIVADLATLPLIAIEFPKFTDGRGYTTARLLRERHGYGGELRAIGEVLRDQLFYMHRVGFDAFQLAPGKSLTDALEAFSEFSVTYQPVGA